MHESWHVGKGCVRALRVGWGVLGQLGSEVAASSRRAVTSSAPPKERMTLVEASTTCLYPSQSQLFLCSSR